MTSCTHHQLRYWDRVDLLRPSVQSTRGRPGVRRLYSFRDLVALRVVRSLLDQGMSVSGCAAPGATCAARRTWRPTCPEVKLVTDGQTIFRVAANDDQLLDALREGQLAFFVAIDEITRSVEEDVTRFELDRERFLEILRRSEDEVATELGGQRPAAEPP